VLLSVLGATVAPRSLADERIALPVAQGITPQVEKATNKPTGKQAAAENARQACIKQCSLADGKCNSEVRQARQECSRNAANSGRDPMTMRNNDYSYFCSYFRNPGRRGPGNFEARFTQHYDLCVDVMQQNIASMRYDCYRNEKDAQNICRSELRDCQAACE
jgi:hypothetical protein